MRPTTPITSASPTIIKPLGEPALPHTHVSVAITAASLATVDVILAASITTEATFGTTVLVIGRRDDEGEEGDTGAAASGAETSRATGCSHRKNKI